MADTSATQLGRLLALLPRLENDEDYPLHEIAAKSGVSAAQMKADLYAATPQADLPGFVDSVTIQLSADDIMSMHKSEFHRPMRLSMSELCALELGLTMLRQERTPSEHAVINGAIAQLQKTIATIPANDDYTDLRHASLMESGRAEHLSALKQAVREHRTVTIRYRSGGATESQDRVICPHAMLYADHAWYVLTLLAGDESRRFRLDRVEHVTVHDERFSVDARMQARVQALRGAFASDTTRKMTVRYSAKIARWVAEREGKAVAADGSLTLEHPVADDAWAVRHVLQYGPEAELLAPVELRVLIAKRLAAIAARTV